MILLDTHIWYWLMQGSPQLSSQLRRLIQSQGREGALVSVISCWEVAKKVQVGKLALDRDLATWVHNGLAHPNVRLIGLSPEIAIESTNLPGDFHKDPADQLIVATARVLDIPLLTADTRILAYPHVRKAEIP